MKVKRIFKGDTGGKEWVRVMFEGGVSWLPKLDELAAIARLIYEVEDNKYQRGRGGEMVRDFLNKAMDGEPVVKLARTYLIPEISEPEKFEPQKWNEA